MPCPRCHNVFKTPEKVSFCQNLNRLPLSAKGFLDVSKKSQSCEILNFFPARSAPSFSLMSLLTTGFSVANLSLLHAWSTFVQFSCHSLLKPMSPIIPTIITTILPGKTSSSSCKFQIRRILIRKVFQELSKKVFFYLRLKRREKPSISRILCWSNLYFSFHIFS